MIDGDLVAALLHGGGDAAAGAASSVARRLDVRVASAFASRTSVTICWSCSLMRCRNSPRSSRSAKPLAFRIDGDQVGLVGLVELDEPRGEQPPRHDQARPQAHQPGALGAQVGLGARPSSRALGVEVGLDALLAALQRRRCAPCRPAIRRE